MGSYQLAIEAQRDVQEIWDYLSLHPGGDAPLIVTDRLFTAMELLAENPGLGRLRPDLSPEPLRVWPVDSFLVVYWPTKPVISIARVIHGARDVAAVLQVAPPGEG